MKTLRTYCRICEAACGLVVERDEHGAPARLKPDKDHPVSRGFACAKGTRFLEVATHPDRLLHPMLRAPDGELRRASWGEALAGIGRAIRPILAQHGPNAVGVYFGNPLAFHALGSFALLAFLKGLDSRNVFSAGSQDCNNKFAGAKVMHGSPVIHPIPDFAATSLAVVLGSNPLVSQSSFVHLEGGSLVFEEIVRRGGEVYWIDPRRTESAKRCGRHLAIRPGTDCWLLLALLRELAHSAPPKRLLDRRVTGLDELLTAALPVTFERAALHTGLAASDIAALAERIRAAESTAFHLSVGVNQSGFGTLAYALLQALAFVSGNFDRRGGSLFHPASVWMAKAYRSAGLDRERTSRIGRFPSVMGTLPGAILADEVLTAGPEQIRAMIVIAGNPLTSIPGGERLRRAFKQLDYLVCVDHFENDTGRVANALLPSASWLERWDFATTTVPFQTTSLMQVAGPVMEAPGEARNDAHILSDLARAIGVAKGPSWAARVASMPLPHPRYGFRGLRPRAGRYLGRGPLNPGNRVSFWDPTFAADLERLGEATLEPHRGEFRMLCRRRRLGHNSWLHGGTHDGEPERVAWMSPDDLAELGLGDGGGAITIETAAGRLTIDAVPEDGLARRTVVVPHGVPGANVNALIPSGADAAEWLSGQHLMSGIAAHVSVFAGGSSSPPPQAK